MLDALGAHLSNAEIASRFHISVRTVESHVSSLLRKFGAADRRELAALAPAVGFRATATGVPSQWTSFVGRARERAGLLAALGQSRLVTLVGPGGVGKTRLAVEVAPDADALFPSGCCFADLVPVRAGFVVHAVASVLGVAEGPQQPLQAAVLEHLARSRTLLVLDNCEHVLVEAAEFADRLLAACPNVRVLATSRERLGVVGEKVLPVVPLSVIADMRGANCSEAASLFNDRARAVDPCFTASRGVHELCTRLEGVPLAIELAAARCASLGVEGMLAAVNDKLRLLSGGRGADPRHHSVRAVIGWSHDLLDKDERAMFRGLGVFVGAFDLDAACVISFAEHGRVTDLVGRLADKSLLSKAPGADRWQMLDTVRAYALEQLTASGDEPAVRERHLRWAEATAAEIERRMHSGLPDPAAWRHSFDAVSGDLRAALGQDVGPGLGQVRCRLSRSLGQLAYSCRYLAEAREHFALAARLASDAGQAAADFLVQAWVAAAEGRGELAFDLSLAAAEKAKAAHDDRARSEALAEAVTVAHRISGTLSHEVTRSRLSDLLDDATHLAAAADPLVAAKLAAAAAWNAGEELSEPDLRLAETALAAARRADDAVLISSCLSAAAEAERAVGRYQRALELSAERHQLIVDLSRHDVRAGFEISDSRDITLAVAAGDLPGALAWADPATSDPLVADQPMTLFRRVIALALRGEFDAAITDAVGMWESWLRAGSPPGHWMAPAAYAGALVHGLRGDSEGVQKWRDRAARIAAGRTGKSIAAFAAFADARVALHQGQHDQAIRALAALGIGERPWYENAHRDYDAYAWVLAAEAAVIAALPAASQLLAATAPAAQENLWAAACFARATGRLHRDRAALEESLAGWQRIGSRFERACTLLLIPELAAQGQAELHALRCPVPAAGDTIGL